MNREIGRVLCAAAATGMLVATGVASRAATGDPVLLNEVLASHTGTDDTEFIELIGTPGLALDGLSLVVVEGDDIASQGRIDRRLDFGVADVIGADGFFLIGNPDGLAANYGVVPNIEISDNYLENSSLTVALVVTSSISGSSVSGGEIVRDAVGLDDGGAGDAFYFGAPVIGPDGPFFPAGARRVADGVDTDTAADWVISDFGLGDANTPQGGAEAPPPVVATIMDIQGDGARSPLESFRVETTGVVTLFTANGANFWMQDAEGDDDVSTSDGIFVAGGGFPAAGPRPSVGDEIRIVALVQEQQFGTALPLTRLAAVAEIEVLSTGKALPAPVVLSDLPDESLADGIDFWEALEGMSVEVKDGYVVAATSRFGEFCMVTKKDRKAGSGYSKPLKHLLIRGTGPNEVDYNPERILVDDSSLESAIEVRPGDKVRRLVGCVDYTFGNFKLQPSSYDVDAHKLPKAPVSRRSSGAGDTTITTFNVENLFDRLDEPTKDDAGSTPTAEALETQLRKLALAIEHELRLPEIVVVQEVENTAILQELGDRVNLSAGTDYRAVSFETSDARGIEVGFLWDQERVKLLDAFQMTGADVSAAFGPSSPSPGREPLVGVFEIEGREVTIIGNHFKSKGGDDALFGVNDPPVRVTETQRKAQARAVRSFVDDLLADDEGALVLVTGDLNDFEFGEPGEGADDPLSILEDEDGDAPLTNLALEERDSERFSYVFDGNSQVLDHMLVSDALLHLVAGQDFLHFNSGYPSTLGEDDSTPLRSSDHDPLEGRFRFGKKAKKSK